MSKQSRRRSKVDQELIRRNKDASEHDDILKRRMLLGFSLFWLIAGAYAMWHGFHYHLDVAVRVGTIIILICLYVLGRDIKKVLSEKSAAKKRKKSDEAKASSKKNSGDESSEKKGSKKKN
ncbi:MAG: hypothetical protein K6G50_08190 [bacterium]|nr:hypothetical protein [bacterium]